MTDDPYGFKAAANSGGGSSGGGNGGGNQGKSGGSKALMYIGIFALLGAAALVKNHDHLSLDMFSKSKPKTAVSSHATATTPLFPTTTTTKYAPSNAPSGTTTTYGAIVYFLEGKDPTIRVFQDYQSKTKLVADIQDEYPGDEYFSLISGQCGAVVYGYLALGTPEQSGTWTTAVASTEDAASSEAESKALTSTRDITLVGTQCED